MTAAKLDLTGDRIIEKGSYWSLEIIHPGDLQESYIRGEIRKGYGLDRVASFKMLPAEYDPIANKTRLSLYLNAGDTKQIPIPPDHWVYDVLLYVPGMVETPVRLLQGAVHVSPSVTDG